MNVIDYITTPGAAAMLGESGTTGGANIRTLAREGKIPGAIKIGRDWLIPRAWAEKKAEEKAKTEEEGRAKRGRPVTTGAGKQRKDRGGLGGDPYATGKPSGSPQKTPDTPD